MPFGSYFTLAGLLSVSNTTEYTKSIVAWMSEDVLIGVFTFFLIRKTHKLQCQRNIALLPGPKPNLNQNVAP